MLDVFKLDGYAYRSATSSATYDTCTWYSRRRRPRWKRARVMSFVQRTVATTRICFTDVYVT
ncbi:hypothetical protein CBL_00707 [Carabus blaptoides fortunei]